MFSWPTYSAVNPLLFGLVLLARGAFASAPAPAGQAVASPTLREHVSITVKDVPVDAVVRLLRQQGIPLSFIEREAFGERGRNVSISAPRGTVEGVLEQVTAQEPAYRFAVMEHRLVLFPAGGRFESEVGGVTIERMPRIRAVWAYTELLASRFPDFAELGTMAVRGRPSAPLYSDTVTLRTRATVLEHLVELLGARESVVFSLTRSRFDTPYLSFEQSGQQRP